MPNFIFSPPPTPPHIHTLFSSLRRRWLACSYFSNLSQYITVSAYHEFFQALRAKKYSGTPPYNHPVYKTAPPHYEPYFFHPNVKITYKGVVIWLL